MTWACHGPLAGDTYHLFSGLGSFAHDMVLGFRVQCKSRIEHNLQVLLICKHHDDMHLPVSCHSPINGCTKQVLYRKECAAQGADRLAWPLYDFLAFWGALPYQRLMTAEIAFSGSTPSQTGPHILLSFPQIAGGAGTDPCWAREESLRNASSWRSLLWDSRAAQQHQQCQGGDPSGQGDLQDIWTPRAALASHISTRFLRNSTCHAHCELKPLPS